MSALQSVVSFLLSCLEFWCNIKARFDVTIKVAAEGEAGSQAQIKAKGNEPRLLVACVIGFFSVFSFIAQVSFCQVCELTTCKVDDVYVLATRLLCCRVS